MRFVQLHMFLCSVAQFVASVRYPVNGRRGGGKKTPSERPPKKLKETHIDPASARRSRGGDVLWSRAEIGPRRIACSHALTRASPGVGAYPAWSVPRGSAQMGGRGRPQVGAGRSAARAWEGAYGSSPCAIPATVAAIRARFRAWACGVGRLVSDMAISQQLAV